MLFNVWVLIWPNQKKILGIVAATDEEKAKARKVAALYASRDELHPVRADADVHGRPEPRRPPAAVLTEARLSPRLEDPALPGLSLCDDGTDNGSATPGSGSGASSRDEDA